jgi:hypothetical protein
MAKRITYDVVEIRGGFNALRRTEWPGVDQRIHRPLSVCINTYPYPTHEKAAKACQRDASWQHIATADEGADQTEIVCEV